MMAKGVRQNWSIMPGDRVEMWMDMEGRERIDLLVVGDNLRVYCDGTLQIIPNARNSAYLKVLP